MVILVRRYIWLNLMALLILIINTMYVVFINFYMDWSKLHELGLKDSQIFYYSLGSAAV